MVVATHSAVGENGARWPVPDLSAEVAEREITARALSPAGDFAASVPIWEHLTTIAVDRWDLALGLAMDLRKRHDFAEAEEVFRRAAARFPLAYWIMFQWALAAYMDDDLDRAEQRAWRILGHSPDEQAGPLILLGDIAMRRRSFAEALHFFERAARINPSDAGLVGRQARAGHYARIAVSFGITPLHSHGLHDAADYGVLVISLDHRTEQFTRFRQAFRDCPISPVRVPGVRGSYLPDAARRTLCRSPGAPPKGTLGCFLAHVAAWETVVARNLDVCLILEDDAAPVMDLPPRYASLGIPADFDLCFVNDRMEPDLDAEVVAGLDGCTLFDPVDALATRRPDHSAPGGDGYFLSAAGARKLLAFVERDGFNGDVDWRLVAYAAPKGAAERLPPDSVAASVLHRTDSLPEPRLRAFTLFPSLVRTAPRGSARTEENQRSTATAE
jgi:tetratricopeptide (TPR) repeat protein